jgi:hypothetical protein
MGGGGYSRVIITGSRSNVHWRPSPSAPLHRFFMFCTQYMYQTWGMTMVGLGDFTVKKNDREWHETMRHLFFSFKETRLWIFFFLSKVKFFPPVVSLTLFYILSGWFTHWLLSKVTKHILFRGKSLHINQTFGLLENWSRVSRSNAAIGEKREIISSNIIYVEKFFCFQLIICGYMVWQHYLWLSEGISLYGILFYSCMVQEKPALGPTENALTLIKMALCAPRCRMA